MRRLPARVLGDRLLPHMKRWRTAGRLAVVTATHRERVWEALLALCAQGKAEARQPKYRAHGKTILGAVLWRRVDS